MRSRKTTGPSGFSLNQLVEACDGTEKRSSIEPHQFIALTHSISCFSRRAESSVSQLENDNKRLRVELQTSKQGEQELKSTMHSLMASERSTKVELQQLKSECEVIQQK